MTCAATRPEGSGDPIAKFEETMDNCDQSTLAAFYDKNMAAIMPLEPA